MAKRLPIRSSSTTSLLYCQSGRFIVRNFADFRDAHRFAYAYTLRTLSLTSLASLTSSSQEVEAAVSMLAQALPFLIEKSQVVLGNIGESVEYVVSREAQGVRSLLTIAWAQELTNE